MDLETLRAAVDAGQRFDYLLFWGHTPKADGTVGPTCFSQWFASGFVVDGVSYPTAEHWMMAEKARLFGDEVMLAEILVAASPADAKKLGRKVAGFEQARWHEHRVDIVVRGNLAKFSQRDDFRDFLLGTGDRVIVEASPRDRIWGIGLGASNPKAKDPRQWRGQNLLGFALMTVRDQLR